MYWYYNTTKVEFRIFKIKAVNRRIDESYIDIYIIAIVYFIIKLKFWFVSLVGITNLVILYNY